MNWFIYGKDIRHERVNSWEEMPIEFRIFFRLCRSYKDTPFIDFWFKSWTLFFIATLCRWKPPSDFIQNWQSCKGCCSRCSQIAFKVFICNCLWIVYIVFFVSLSGVFILFVFRNLIPISYFLSYILLRFLSYFKHCWKKREWIWREC